MLVIRMIVVAAAIVIAVVGLLLAQNAITIDTFVGREGWVGGTGTGTGTVRFLTALETAQLIINDEDGFIAKMSEEDLKDRGSFGRQGDDGGDADLLAYRRAAALSATAYNPREVVAVREAVAAADRMLGATEPRAYPGIDLKAVAAMNWEFAMVRGRSYENGKAHFRLIGNRFVVFFSDWGFETERWGSDAAGNASRRQLQNTLIYFKFEAWAALNREKVGGFCQDGVVRYLQGGRVGTLGTPVEVGQEHVYEWSPWNQSSTNGGPSVGLGPFKSMKPTAMVADLNEKAPPVPSRDGPRVCY